MRIDFTQKVFTKAETELIVAKLEQAVERGLIIRRFENNPYLLASFCGVEGKGISHKWNAKIYEYSVKKRGHSVVCVDAQVLRRLVEEDYASFVPPDLKVLRIDDAGWGFPLCGVMVGVSDEKEVRTAVVPVEYFRHGTQNHFGTKRYLKKYSDLAVQLLEEFRASPETHRIEICTGYVNQPLREQLRGRGYDVRVTEIKGLLQVELEERYREYVIEEVGADIYYDPKDMKKSEIPQSYRNSLRYGERNCPEQIKTGWDAIKGGG
jgi:hypothetical protein